MLEQFILIIMLPKGIEKAWRILELIHMSESVITVIITEIILGIAL